MTRTKLTSSEIKRLLGYIKKFGSRQTVAENVGVNTETLDRTIRRDTAPSHLFRMKLIEIGVIKK